MSQTDETESVDPAEWLNDPAQLERVRRLLKEAEESGDYIDGETVRQQVIAGIRERFGSHTEE